MTCQPFRISSFQRLLLLAAAVLLPGTLPLMAEPWLDSDIGAVGSSGSSGMDDDGLWTLEGAGAGVGGTSDSFNFSYKQLAGAKTLTMHVGSVGSSSGMPNQFGLMVRSTLDTNSACVFLQVNTAGTPTILTRTKAGAVAKTKAIKIKGALPTWLRVQITSSGKKATVKALTSVDGTTWVSAGSGALPTAGYYLGLAVSAQSAPTLATATADHVSQATPGSTLYTYADMGTLGGEQKLATALNNLGEVVGYGYKDNLNTQYYAFVCSGGQMTDLGLGVNSLAFGINDAGQISVTKGTGYYSTYILDGDDLIPLGSIDNTNGGGMGKGINASGQVAGFGSVRSNTESHGFLYDGQQMIDIGALIPVGIDSYSQAVALNDSGAITGNSVDAKGNNIAIYYAKGKLTKLGTLGGTYSYGYAINAAGQVAGAADTRNATHAFLTSPGGKGMKDIGTLGGTEGRDASYATGVNNTPQVVGFSYEENSYESAAISYEPKVGMVDLNYQLTTPFDGRMVSAAAINQPGQILVNGTDGNAAHQRIYLLTPAGTYH